MQNIKLAHYNDGKHKYQSHEISIYNKDDEYFEGAGIFGVSNIPDIIGYGGTEEEAREDFKKKFNNAFKCLLEFHEKLNSDTESLEQIETDYAGNKVE